MATTTEIQAPQTRSAGSTARVKGSAVPAILVLSQAPLLWLHFRDLWGRDHYQFFPLLLAGFAMLLWQRWPRERRLDSCEQHRGEGTIVLVAFGLLALATAIYSWLIASVAAVFTALALLRHYAGRDWTRLLPVWALLWLLVPPPLSGDFALVNYLQGLTSRASGLVLEQFGIQHLMMGNVIELAGERLLVEEACSGIQSLFALLALTALYVVWTRATWLHATLLLLAVPIWALLANTLRVTIVALAFEWTGADLAHGWRHELLGFVTFTLAVGLLASTDQLLRFLFAPIPHLSPLLSEQSPVSRLWNRLTGGASLPAVNSTPPVENSKTDLRTQRRGFDPLRAWPIAFAFGLLGVGQLVPLVSTQRVETPVAEVIASIGSDTLPDQQDGWQKINYDTEQRGASSSWGEFSKIWRYQSASGPMHVSLDYPFRGWHNLMNCYAGQGWKMKSCQIIDSQQVPYLEVNMSHPISGESGLLLFGFFDAEGRDLMPEGPESPLGARVFFRVANGLQRGPLGLVMPGGIRRSTTTSYQLQLLTVSEQPQSPDARGQIRKQYSELRRQLKQHWQAAATSSGTASE